MFSIESEIYLQFREGLTILSLYFLFLQQNTKLRLKFGYWESAKIHFLVWKFTDRAHKLHNRVTYWDIELVLVFFLVKIDALFWKICKETQVKVLSIASHYFFPIFLAAYEFYVGKTIRLFRLSKSQPIIWNLYKKGSAAQSDHVSSIRTSDNREGQCFVNTAGGVGLPI